MATFSPSPAPRPSSRLRPTANSPPAASKRIRVGSSRPASRFATPVRAAERMSIINDNASFASGMDVDDANSMFSERGPKTETIFAKSEELFVSFYAHLPVEVRQALKNADFYGVAYTGDVDTLTGFALVASVQTCFVWQHAQAVKGTPTCYIFACPRDHDQTGPPLHALVPYAPTREPGLILASLSGEIRFWNSIGIGLAGGEHYSTTTLGLSAGESVTNLIRSDPKTYIATSSTGHLFRLTVTSSGGKHHLNSSAFSHTQSSMSLSRLLPMFWSSSSSSIIPESGNVGAVSLGAKTALGRELWVLVDTRLQKWNMASDVWEEVVLDQGLAGIIRPAVRKAFTSASMDNSTLDLELLDLAVENSGQLVILASYAGIEEAIAVDMVGIRRIYTLIRLSYAADTIKVESVVSVPYQSTSRSGAPMHPRIQLLMGGSIVSIQFGDAVVLCARDSGYQDRLELKSATDRTLGVGVVEDAGVLFVLTATTMMKACVDMEKVASIGPDSGRANLIKSIMTQAILYGSYPENPLHFSFPPDVDEESLMQGAEQLSQAILESDSEVVRRNHDLGAQLTGRKERLSWLIRFINDNAALTKMSQRSRQQLATDAEKLYACHQLWLQYNDVLATGHTDSILNEAVYTYMNEIGEGHHEDVMRAFFRHKVTDIDRLLSQAMQVMMGGSDETDPGLLSETNHVILTVLKSALNYREYNLGVYGIELPMIAAWTGKPTVIDIVLGLFSMTTKFVESPPSESGVDQGLLTQLPELASILFACIQERLDWLGSPAAADDAERHRKELEDRFAQLRPEALETIRRNGHADRAFALAEGYRDFRSLASLCHTDRVFPPQDNPNAVRIQNYMEKFRQEFATELYRWYIEHGELRVLFALEDAHSAYMDNFFAENPNPLVSWIHDIGKTRHSAASEALLTEAENATDLGTKHLMLSIGKLAHLAQLHETDALGDEAVLDAFHDELDFVSVHETLLEEFKTALSYVRGGKQTLVAQVETVAKYKASKLVNRKALLHLFKQLVRQILQGKALHMEDVVDVLTLKDNTSTMEDYATALHLLARVKSLPDARRISAFQSVWRRIYIHDDWDQIRRTANVTDTELSDRFQRTALYSSLLEIIPKQPQPEGYDLLPAQALPVPSPAEISSRWPGMSPDQAEAIAQDYKSESDELAELALDDVYHRVRELVVREVVWGSGS